MKKVIQVPMDEALLENLNHVSKRQNRPRADVIREACSYYIDQLQVSELDTAYQRGYERIPENGVCPEAQLAVIAQVLPEEEW